MKLGAGKTLVLTLLTSLAWLTMGNAALAATTSVSLTDGLTKEALIQMGLQPPGSIPTGTVCGAGPDLIVHDDNQGENGYGWNASANVGRMNDKFTPATYPAGLDWVCTAFITNAGVTSFNVNLVVYDDDGTGGEPGTVLGSKAVVVHPAAIGGLPFTPSFEAFSVSDLAIYIASGSVYISVEWDAAAEPGGVYLGADETLTTPLAGGYMRANADPWAPTQTFNPDYRALMIRAVMPIAGPGAPSLSKTFAPTQVLANASSTLTITLNNASQPTAAVLSAALTDTLPAGLVIAPTPNAATTCAGGSVTAAAGSGSVTLASGASIPANGNCTITVDVTSAADGSYVNIIAAGALQTQHGNNANPATATLTVGFTFPEPYCAVNFPSGVEPITRVVFADIDNTSPATGGPALQDFTAIVGNVAPGDGVQMTVEGNTAGPFSTPVMAYIDWDQNGVFDVGTEGYTIGTLNNSNGTDGQQVTANITVPLTAASGSTRMRVIKKFNTPADPCNTAGYGQAEDYTLSVLGASWTVTPAVSGGNGSIAPNTPQSVPDGDTIIFTLTPDPGYEIASVSGCGGTLVGNIYTTGPITGDCTVTASFRPVAAPARLIPTLNQWVLGLLGLLMAGFALLLWPRRTG